MRWFGSTALLSLAGCFLGGQSGDPDEDEVVDWCAVQRLEWDEQFQSEELTPREWVEQRSGVTVTAFWFAPDATEPPGGFEPGMALGVGEASITLEPNLEQLSSLTCDSNLELPVLVTVSLSDGFMQTFDGSLQEAIGAAAAGSTSTYLTIPGVAGEQGDRYSYLFATPEFVSGQLWTDERRIHWGTACGKPTQTPLGTPGASGVPSVVPLLENAGTRELRAEGLPALRLTLWSSDPTRCDELGSYRFGAEIVAQTSGVSDTFVTEFSATTLDPAQGSLALEAIGDHCFDVSTSEEWASIATREGAERVLCITVFYSLGADGQIGVGAEANLRGSSIGWNYE